LIFLSVHLKQEEKLTIRCSRDGGVETLEVHGMIMLRVKSEEYGRVLVAIDNKESRNIQLQVKKKSFFFKSNLDCFLLLFYRHIQILIKNYLQMIH